MSSLNKTDHVFYSETGMSKSKVKAAVTDCLKSSDGGELYLEQGFGENLYWREGKLESSSSAISEGFGLRYIMDDKFAFASSNHLDIGAIQNAAKTVSALRTHGHQANLNVKLPKSRVRNVIYDPADPILAMDKTDKIEIIKSVDDYIRGQSSLIRDVSVSLAANHKMVQIIRADGHRVADIRPMLRFNIAVTVEKNGVIENRSYGYGGRYDLGTLFNEATMHHAADEALRQAIVALDAEDIAPCSLPIVMAPGWPAVMIHEAVGHGLEGDAIRKGQSVYAGKVGQKVASDNVTIIDQGTFPGLRGSINFDDEGIKAQKNVLIKDGVLVGYMQDQLNARLMGANLTGNGRRESYDCAPLPRMTSTFLAAGQHSPQDIIGAVDKGIYIANMSGGSVDTVSGDFNFAVTEAYLIEKGIILYDRPIKNVTVLGNGPRAMQNVRMLGNDLALDPGIGVCGKQGQGVPVGIGQPTVLMDGLKIGGRKG